MNWIKIDKDSRPEFDKCVLVTSTEVNKEENGIEMSVCYLDRIEVNSSGVSLIWEDIYDSGIQHPTHYCEIPEFNPS